MKLALDHGKWLFKQFNSVLFNRSLTSFIWLKEVRWRDITSRYNPLKYVVRPKSKIDRYGVNPDWWGDKGVRKIRTWTCAVVANVVTASQNAELRVGHAKPHHIMKASLVSSRRNRS
jgi:hypothetical protein